jgi:hypothetical protein
MNLQEPFKTYDIDFNNIVYTKVKTNDSKKIIYIKYNKKSNLKPFVVQIPSILNTNEPVKITEDYYELEIPLITQEKRKNESLINFFENLDRQIIQDAKINSKTWFENINDTNSIKYKKIIKESDSYKEGVLKIKIIKNNDFETLLQIVNKRKINVKEIPNNSWCKMLVEIYAVVINTQSNTFSLFLRPIILAFKEKEVINYNYTFLEDSDSDTNVDNVPDSELNNIFIKNIIKTNYEDNNTSSQIKPINEVGKLLSSSETNTSSSNSSEKLEAMLNNISNAIPENTVPILDEEEEFDEEKVDLSDTSST